MEMKDEDQPEEKIWLDDEALNEHFDMVRARYAAERKGEEPVEQADMTSNEHAQALRRG